MLRILRSKLPSKREWRPPAEVFDTYVSAMPRLQNAVDAIGGWTCAFPPELGVEAGDIRAFDDARIRWAIDCFGPLDGRSVLELGPGEASHSFLLHSAGARIDAIEPSRAGFIRCLIAKEVMRLARARFWLGDMELFLRETDKVFDLVVACDVLHRFADPLAAVELLAKRADAVFIHTQVAPEATEGEARLPRRDDLIAALRAAGFSDIRATEGQPPSAVGVFARK